MGEMGRRMDQVQEEDGFGAICRIQIPFLNPVHRQRSTQTCISDFAGTGPNRSARTLEAYPWVRKEYSLTQRRPLELPFPLAECSIFWQHGCTCQGRNGQDWAIGYKKDEGRKHFMFIASMLQDSCYQQDTTGGLWSLQRIEIQVKTEQNYLKLVEEFPPCAKVQVRSNIR